MNRHKSRLIALHCASKGIGFAVFEGTAIYDWGTVVARDDKNAMSLRKLMRLLDRYSPETLVLEDADTASGRSSRIIALYEAIASLCKTRNIDIYLYRLADIQVCFGFRKRATRQDIAESIVRQIDVLSPRLPSPRKPWQSEPRRMAIFSAVAVAMTHIAGNRK